MKQFLTIFVIGMMIPYITTLAWTGRVEDFGVGTGSELSGEANTEFSDVDEAAVSGAAMNGTEKQVVVIRNGRETGISVEAFLPHVLAAQIPADFEMETLKAQAVLARTYIYREIEAAGLGNFIYEEALDMDAWSKEQMEEKWGSKAWADRYGRLERAAAETAGMVLSFGGEYVEPLFCYASSGTTRSHGEEFPYLRQAVSPGDLLAENYLSVSEFTASEMAGLINEIPGGVDISAAQIPGEIQIVERDAAGYVRQIQVGKKTYTGEEIQYALGLPSSCYSFEQSKDKIRSVCKGVGHGYGFAQFGANEMAKEGKNFQELLGYYFQNVEIVSKEAADR